MFDAIVMADLHFGAIEVSRFEWELDKCLFDRINHIKKLDAVIIAGDLFDMKEYSTSTVFKAVITFIKRLIAVTEKLGSQIIVIKGTRTHDDYQLQTLQLIFKSCERIKFIHTVCDDEIKGVKFLYVPEEYVLDQEDYYKDWFSKHYDIMIGHGTIDAIWRSKKQKRDDITSAPVFNVVELCKVANYCYFGHEHMHKEYGTGFRYIGPMTVWEYDKTVAGYYEIHYSPENCMCREVYHKNSNAQKLITNEIYITSDTTMDTVMNTVEEMINQDYDGLKIKVFVTDDNPIFIQAKEYLVTKIGLYPNVKLDLQVMELTEETEEEKKERIKTEELHSAIFEDNLPDESVIAEFIKSKNGKDIPLDRIKEICGIGEIDNG